GPPTRPRRAHCIRLTRHQSGGTSSCGAWLCPRSTVRSRPVLAGCGPVASGWAYLAGCEAELLPEVPGELVRPDVAHRRRDVLDGRAGQRRILQPAASLVQAQLLDQLHRCQFGVLEYGVQIPRRDVGFPGDPLRIECRVAELPADDAFYVRLVQQAAGSR